MTKTLKLDHEIAWKFFLFLCISSFVLMYSDIALANEDAAAGDAIGQQLCRVVQTLTGGIAKSVATIAIIGVAGGLLLGKLQWPVALTVAVGVIIIFSAGQIVAFVSGEEGITADTDCDQVGVN